MSSVPTKKLILRISLRLVLIVAVLLCLGLIVPPLLGLFLPFLLAFVAATLLAPLVQKFAKRVGGWNFWSMLFVVLMLLAVTGILVYAGYYLVSQVTDLIRSWTSIREGITDMLNQVSQFLSNNVHFTSTDTEEYILGHLQDGLSWLTGKISTWAPTVVVGVSNLASGIVSFLISLLFFIVAAYFMTADYPGLRKRLIAWVPDIIRPHMRHVKEAAGSAMFGYLRAQLILSGVVLVIVFVALLIFRQPYSLLIAIATGIIDIMPFFGSGAILVPWGVICLLVGNLKKALFLLILAFALFLFRKLAEPKVVGNQTGLSPLLSLISIYVGMKLGGVAGMILCPIACMVVIGLYGMGFFTPTIQDFRMLFGRVLEAARLPGEAGDSGEDSEGEK